MKIIIQDRKVCNIPILDIYEANEKEKRPIVIMLHGAKARYEEIGHTVTNEMLEEAYKWIKAHI